MSEQDFSLKMSQFNSLDETRNILSDRVRMLEDENDQLREEGRALSEMAVQMKKRMVEVERLEFQLREARDDS
jgi:predicted  nucleic acid-binding Zn-ribbon protein